MLIEHCCLFLCLHIILFFFESFGFVVVDVVVVRGCGFAIDFKQVDLLLCHISCIC